MTRLEMPELTAEIEGGWVDLCLKLENLTRDSDGACRLEASALFEGQIVAFAITLGTTWEPLAEEGMAKSFYRGGAHIKSLGSQSDAFIRSLDQLYGTKIGASRMRDDIVFIAVSLEGHPLRLEAESLKLKLFFESETDDLCAEFYLNCDVNVQRVQFREKDTDFRRALVLALAQPAA
jgi:hypothetical protein